MKQILSLVLCLALAVIISSPAFAEGDGNMDGGGGSMGGGTGTNYWHDGEDGVRVTVIRIGDNPNQYTVASTPFDLTNYSESNVVRSFNKRCKIQYP
jgi:hypothetical protein